MAVVVFYEKPGCRTNARQKKLLEDAGHTVVARNLLAERWSATDLLDFFGNTAVSTWFNPAAPRVKSGEVDPGRADAAKALALLRADPLLIRRPLIEVGGQKCAGFDSEPVLSLLGALKGHRLSGCSQPNGAACPAPRQAAK